MTPFAHATWSTATLISAVVASLWAVICSGANCPIIFREYLPRPDQLRCPIACVSLELDFELR